MSKLRKPTIPPARQMPERDRELIARLRSGETVVLNYSTDKAACRYASAAGLLVYIGRRTRFSDKFRLPFSDWSFNRFNFEFERLPVTGDYIFTLREHLFKRLPELKGKALVCFCSPAPCHGDHLKALADEAKEPYNKPYTMR